MDIKYAILGFLSWRPLAGYDLKKLFEGSGPFYWSGNNNQIYRALVELHDAGLVTNEVQPQAHLPARKVYSLTDAGAAALDVWLGSQPELPQLRHGFLVQLAWADRLEPAALDELLARYEREAGLQALMAHEQDRRGTAANPARTPREALLWRAIYANQRGFWEHELAWVRALREELAKTGEGQ